MMRRMIQQVISCSTVACAVCTASLAAVTVDPNVQVSSGSQNAQEISAVATPGAPHTLLAVWQEKQVEDAPIEFGVLEVSRIMAGVSTDGGASWTQYAIRPPSLDPNITEGDPMAAFDPRTGQFWAGGLQVNHCGAGGSGEGTEFITKLKSDNTFDPSPAASVLAWHGCQPPDKGLIVAGRNESTPDSTRLYLAFNQGLVLSDDAGINWSQPPYVIDPDAQGHVPRIAPDGRLFDAYFSGPYYKIVRSDNGGVTFNDVKSFSRKACCTPQCPFDCNC